MIFQWSTSDILVYLSTRYLSTSSDLLVVDLVEDEENKCCEHNQSYQVGQVAKYTALIGDLWTKTNILPVNKIICQSNFFKTKSRKLCHRISIISISTHPVKNIFSYLTVYLLLNNQEI